MAGEAIKWTDQQRAAIESRGDILVTASAGTGKTAVLSRRCVEIISDKDNPANVNELLVLTFTEAAAEEMRERIADTLRQEYLRTADPHLKKQLLLIDAAEICTIHSFCKRIITEHFYQLGLDPSFQLIDEDEQDLIKSEVIEKVVEDAWNDPQLRSGMNQLLSKRKISDFKKGFIANVLKVAQMLTGVVDKNLWYERALGNATFDAQQKQKEIIAQELHSNLEQLKIFSKIDIDILNGHYALAIDEVISLHHKAIGLLESDSIDKFLVLIDGLSNEKIIFKRRPKGSDPQYYDYIREGTRKTVGILKALKNYAILNPRYEEIVGAAADLQTRVLLQLIKMFDLEYSNRKKDLNCLDFSDLEHYAFKLLNDDAQGSSSEVALKLQQKYKYVFVDEYQDVNEVEDAIARKVSKGENLFVVGDVKQSIYAWRQARPEIFLRHLNSASILENKELRLDLNSNFRSRKEVLDFANRLFGKIMSPDLGGVIYDESAALKAAAEYKSLDLINTSRKYKTAVELHIFDEDGDMDDENDDLSDSEESNNKTQLASKMQKQACFIAARIKEMLGKESQSGNPNDSEFKVYDKKLKDYRDIKYCDIVILMRSLSNQVNELTEVLRMAGIPVDSTVSSGYFETTEITDCLTLLKVINNQQIDIDLAAVLRSPFFNFSDTQLAKIRIETPNDKASFDHCLREYISLGKDELLKDKIKDALKLIQKWRKLSKRKQLGELLWTILRETSYLSFVSALPNGRQRKANLLKLHERAIQFEGFVSCGNGVSLSRFIEFIERLLENENDWAQDQPESQSSDGVRIMSIHKSKGLEFPIVFLAGLEKSFNDRDSLGDCLCDDKLAIGLRVIDANNNMKFSSLAHQVISRAKQDTTLNEEMRILYVAITRAREKLILVGAKKSSSTQKRIIEAQLFADKVFPAWLLKRSKSHLDWLLFGMSDQKSLLDCFEIDIPDTTFASQQFITAKLYNQQEIEAFISEIFNLKKQLIERNVSEHNFTSDEIKKADTALQEIKKSINWTYDHVDSVVLKAKSSVSELTHRNDEFVLKDISGSLQRKPMVIQTRSNVPDSRIIGTAYHLVMQSLDLKIAVDQQTISSKIAELVNEGLLDKRICDRIDPAKIFAFFKSSLAAEVLSPQNKIHREWPFTITVKNETGNNCNTTDSTIVQGIVDLVIEQPDSLTIIDFKTDRISADQLPQRSQLYRQQLELYAEAAEKIFSKKCQACWLYFLDVSQEFQII